MDLVHERGSMDLVQSGGPWTPGPCFVLTLHYTTPRREKDAKSKVHQVF